VIVDLRIAIGLARRSAMNCFECAKANDAVAAVGVCRHCGVGLCLDHLVEGSRYRVGAARYGCGHELPVPRPLHDVPAGISDGSRHVRGGTR
jgi:hypothetical protein